MHEYLCTVAVHFVWIIIVGCHEPRKYFNTKILHTKIFHTKFSQITVVLLDCRTEVPIWGFLFSCMGAARILERVVRITSHDKCDVKWRDVTMVTACSPHICRNIWSQAGDNPPGSAWHTSSIEYAIVGFRRVPLEKVGGSAFHRWGICYWLPRLPIRRCVH